MKPCPDRVSAAVCVSALTLTVLLGCEDPPPPPPPPPPVPAALEPIVAGRTIADDAGFALIPVAEGALLLWAVPYREGGGVRAVRLSATGAALGSDSPVAAHGAAAGGTAEQHVSQAVELDAFASGRRVGVAWVLDFGHHLSTQATWSSDGGERFGEVEDLGETVRLEAGQRGRIALSADDEGTLIVHHRIQEGPCVSSSGQCAMFRRHGLGVDAGRAGRGAEPLEVRTPCEPFVASALFRAGTWYHGICHESAEQGPSTTIYAVRPEVSYAAPTLFEGCVPAGLAPLDRGVLAMARCGDDWVGRHLDEMGQVQATFRPAERTVRCEEGRPVLRIGPGRREAKLQLGAAMARLEALLPEDVAPSSARAIWTGEAILVAVPQQRSLSVRRYQCRKDGRLDRSDVR